MTLSKKEKQDILRTCDQYFENDKLGNYAVEKKDFIELIQAMLDLGVVTKNYRGSKIWEKLSK